MKETKYFRSLRTIFYRITLLLTMMLYFNCFGWGQIALYSTNFGTTTAWPSGWTTGGTVPWVMSTNGSSGYTGASSSGSVLHANASGEGTLTYNNNLSTTGYINITVMWGALRVGINTASLWYSINNGSVWIQVSLTDVNNDNNWHWVNNNTRITLPAEAEGVSNLMFQWRHTGYRDYSTNYVYRLDDFTVQGTLCTPPAAPTVITPVNYCQNAIASPLTATGSSLLWYTTPNGVPGSATAPTPVTTSTGTMSYYVSQTDGCEGPRAPIAVIVHALPTFSVSKTDVTCYGKADGTIIVTATGGSGTGYTFSKDGSTYEGSGNLFTFTGLSANFQYKIRVKDSNGCESPAIPQ